MHVTKDEREMLAALGMDSVERLFDDIPGTVRTDLSRLGKSMSEQEVKIHVENILAKNTTTSEMPCFVGAGSYDFYVPSAVKHIVSRSEFITSYTPYQPEFSQGLLHALFEYQSMMCELTGMDVVNNSIYDMATALGEAALMAARLSGGDTFLVPEALPPAKFSVLQSYCRGPGIKLKRYKFDRMTGTADLSDFKGQLSENVIGAYVEMPNILGVFETSMDELRQMLGSKILVAGVNPLSLAIVRPPGEYGADIAISEGQMLGNPINFGGPALGILSCKKEHVRKMPGRVIGMTSDAEGKRAFCMTLMTREQHIRREKATSNICTNEALTTIAAASYMALLGGEGLRKLAISVKERADELAKKLDELKGTKAPVFSAPHFNEFTASFEKDSSKVFSQMVKKGVIPGLPLSDVAGLKNEMLVSVTDTTTDKDMDALVKAMKEVL
jgi:glycine dehydrogenase subunit 1